MYSKVIGDNKQNCHWLTVNRKILTVIVIFENNANNSKADTIKLS